MSNVYRFAYDSSVDDSDSPYPQATTVKVRHYFDEESTWVPILWQFAKFLESVGYVGVCEKIVIKDRLGLLDVGGSCFETYNPDDTDANRWGTYETDDEEEIEESELDVEEDFRDMKKEVA
jgi:hypothetical protein